MKAFVLLTVVVVAVVLLGAAEGNPQRGGGGRGDGRGKGPGGSRRSGGPKGPKDKPCPRLAALGDKKEIMEAIAQDECTDQSEDGLATCVDNIRSCLRELRPRPGRRGRHGGRPDPSEILATLTAKIEELKTNLTECATAVDVTIDSADFPKTPASLQDLKTLCDSEGSLAEDLGIADEKVLPIAKCMVDKKEMLTPFVDCINDTGI